MSRSPYKFSTVRVDDDESGKNVAPYATVQARNSIGAPADIYFQQSGGSSASSFILDANGEKQIWAEPGIYSFSVAGGDFFTVLIAPESSVIVSAEKAKGAWNASTNTPALTSGTGTAGDYYEVSVAGNANLDGNTGWLVGDRALFNGTSWSKLPQASFVRGPSSSINDQLAFFDGPTGKLLKAGQTLGQYLDAFLVTLYNVFPRTLNTYAEISTTPIAIGQKFSIKQHTSGGVGGGQFVGVASAGLTPDGIEISATATSGVYAQRAIERTVYAGWAGLLGDSTDVTAKLNQLSIVADKYDATLVMDVKQAVLSDVFFAPQRIDGHGCIFKGGKIKFTARKNAIASDFTCEFLWCSGVWNSNFNNITVTKVDSNNLPIPSSGDFLIDGREANWGTFWNTFNNVRCSNRIVIDVSRQAVNQNLFNTCLGNGNNVYGLLITDRGAPISTVAYTGGLVINNRYQGVTYLGETYSLNDVVSVPYTCTTWATDSANFTQRGIMEAHNNNFFKCDFSHSEGVFNDIQVRNQTNTLSGCYMEHGANAYGNWNVIDTIIDGDSPPIVTPLNHVFNTALVSSATWGDSISASVENACIGGDWSQRKADGTPVGFSASFAAQSVGIAGTPYGYTAIYGMPSSTPVTGAFQYFDVDFISHTGQFSGVIWLYAPTGELPVSVLITDGVSSESYRNISSIHNDGNGFYLFRISGAVAKSVPQKVRFLLTNAETTSRLCWLGAAWISSEKAALFPYLLPLKASQTTSFGGVEFKRGAIDIPSTSSSPIDVVVEYGEPFPSTIKPIPSVTMQCDTAAIANYTKSALIASDNAGFTYRIYFTGTFYGSLNWSAESAPI